ncbi:MAG: sulfotransferase [Sphingomonadales bacterium]
MSTTDVARLASSAELLLRTGRFPEAIEAYRELLSRSPNRPEAWFNLGYLQRNGRQFEDALASYAEAIALGIRQPEEAHVNRAAILSEHLFRTDEAERELQAALALAPTFLIAWHNLGQLREDRNDKAGAREAYQAALALAPNDGRANARLATLDMFDGKVADAIERLCGPLASATDAMDAAELSFAMANASDALGDYDAAFSGFQRANALAAQVSKRQYDPAAQDRLINETIAAFPTPIPRGDVVPTTPEPLFICGMFRSGSTLCEQLLARHSQVTSGGELEILPALASNMVPPYPALSGSIPETEMGRLRGEYLAELRGLFPDAEIVTDKRPDNFLYIGLIKAMFPAARIVHTMRNPLDNILSVFFLYFADSVTYGSRVEDILHFYKGYKRLMAHWQRLYPDIIDIDYDALVRAPEEQTRALLAKLDLEWEAQCDPARASASDVRTASAWQVRQPIHRRSTGRWRNYTSHISALREALTHV